MEAGQFINHWLVTHEFKHCQAIIPTSVTMTTRILKKYPQTRRPTSSCTTTLPPQCHVKTLLQYLLQELLKIYSRLCQDVHFVVTRVHAGDRTILRVIQAGEDLGQKLKETGNIMPFLYAARLLQFLDLINEWSDSNLYYLTCTSWGWNSLWLRRIEIQTRMCSRSLKKSECLAKRPGSEVLIKFKSYWACWRNLANPEFERWCSPARW